MLSRVTFLLLATVCLVKLIEIQSVAGVRTECPLETYSNWTRLTNDCTCSCSCYDGNDATNGRAEIQCNPANPDNRPTKVCGCNCNCAKIPPTGPSEE